MDELIAKRAEIEASAADLLRDIQAGQALYRDAKIDLAAFDKENPAVIVFLKSERDKAKVASRPVVENDDAGDDDE